MSGSLRADPGLYEFAPWRGRPRLEWPGGKTCAVWVAPNLEFYELDPPANPHRKSRSNYRSGQFDNAVGQNERRQELQRVCPT